VRAILISLDRIASSRTAPQCNEKLRSFLPAEFRPQFSYVEDTRRQLQRLRSSVGSMASLRNNSSILRHMKSAKAALPNVAGENEILLGLLSSNFNRWYETILLESCMDSYVGTYDVFGEYDYNRQLESLGASRMLLRELATTIESQVVRLEFALAFLGNDESDNRNETSSILSATSIKRKTKTSFRVVRTSEIIQLFYLFCSRIVTENLPREQQGSDSSTSSSTGPYLPTDNQKVSKHSSNVLRRTRMVLSTVDTFLDTNIDRAVKSIATFAQSKAVKEYE